MPDFTPTLHGHREFKAVGIRRWHNFADASTTIPPQWNELNARQLPERNTTGESFGITTAMDMPQQRFEYLAGYEIEPTAATPEGLDEIHVPAAHYAVFSLGSVAEIQPLWQHIFQSWLPSSGYKPAGTPDFERYDEHFNPVTRGPLQIWFPIAR